MYKTKSECNKINDSIKDCKSQTDANMNSLRLMVNQNMEEIENNIGNLTHDIRSVVSSLEECNSSVQMDKQNYQVEIQRLESEIKKLRAKVNGNLALHNESAVCASPQNSTTIRVTDVGRPISQASLTFTIGQS